MTSFGRTRCLLAVFFILLACGVGLASVQNPQPAFEDDFAAVSSAWQLGGNWANQDGILRHSPVGFGDAILQPWAWTDFAAEIPLSVDEFGLYGSLRFMFRWQGAWQGYGLTFHEQQTVLYRFDGAFNVNQVLGSSSFRLQPGRTYHVKVTAEGDRFEVSVDGAVILQARDAANMYTSGRLGMKADNVSAGVEGIVLYGESQSIASLRAASVALPDGEDFTPRSQPVITGTFLQLDSATLNWSPGMWGYEFNTMEEIGLDTLILQYAAYNGTPYYPSEVFAALPGRQDILGMLLDHAEERGMKVWLGLSYSGEWISGALASEIATNKRVIDELAEAYGEHPAFAGWYLPHELQLTLGANVSAAITDFYATLADYARSKTPGKPVAIAPYFAVSPWDSFGETAVETWRRFLEASRIDVVMLQDGIGANPERTIEEILPYYAVMRKAADRAGVAFWNDLENFTAATWQSVSHEQVLEKLEALAPYVEKTVIFEFNHYMSPMRGWQQRQQYEGYRAYYEGLE